MFGGDSNTCFQISLWRMENRDGAKGPSVARERCPFSGTPQLCQLCQHEGSRRHLTTSSLGCVQIKAGAPGSRPRGLQSQEGPRPVLGRPAGLLPMRTALKCASSWGVSNSSRRTHWPPGSLERLF